MKAQMLKIAGVKSEAEFYKKFPDEESFMKAHGKEFKKALRSSKVKKAQVGIKTPPKESDFPGDYEGYAAAMDAYNASLTQQIPAVKNVGQIEPIGMEGPQLAPSAANLAQQTLNWGTPNQITGIDKLPKLSNKFDPMSAIPLIGGVIGAVNKIAQQNLAIKRAKQAKEVTGVQARAATLTEAPMKEQYSRPEDFVTSGMEVYPYTYGSPYEILKAQDGVMVNQVGGIPGEIANTFAPGNIYNDMGYEPLSESDKIKQYQQGGGINQFANAWKNSGVDTASLVNMIGGGGYQRGGFGDIGSGISSILPKVLTGKAAGLAGPIGIATQVVGGAIDAAMKAKEQAYLRQAERNQAQMFGSNLASVYRSAHPGMMEDGGQVSDYEWVSHTWQPQTITHFGEHRLSDLLKPPHDADMLRAGGHLKSYTPPSEKAMQTFDMGGGLTVDGRGDIDFMGYNPVTASTGASGYVGISRGPSHDNGGFNIDYNGNKVEIEGGETIMEKKDGGPVGDAALNVLGNLKMGIFAGHIFDGINPTVVKSLLKGRNPKDVKFKHIGNDIVKETKRLNNLENKYVDIASSADPSSKFGKLELGTARTAIDNGIHPRYQILDTIQNNMIDHQAIANDISEKLGINADKFAATGKAEIDKEAMKEAQGKYGKAMKKAQKGMESLGTWKSPTPAVPSSLSDYIWSDRLQAFIPKTFSTGSAGEIPKVTLDLSDDKYAGASNSAIKGLYDLLERKGYNMSTTSGLRPGAKTKQGKESRHGKGEALDIKFPTLGSSAYKTILNDPDVVTYMMQNGITAINEYDPNVGSATGATGPHIHFGLDRGTALSDQFRKDAISKYPNLSSVVSTGTTGAKSQIELPIVSEKDYNYLKGLYEAAKAQKKGNAVSKFQEEFHKIAPDYAKKVLSEYDVTTFGKSRGYSKSDLRSNVDAIFGPRTERYMSALAESQRKPTVTTTGTGEKTLEVPKVGGDEMKTTGTTPKVTVPAPKQDMLSSIFGQIAPYFRRDTYPGLDWRQILGETMAMGEQPEGVKAQLPQPILRQPFTVSFQNRLNEITADTNAALKAAAGNPAAAASILAESRRAKDAVLADQFRTNQQIFSGISGENLAELRSVRDKQLEILGKQAFQQATAKSITKAMKMGALQSIANKELQNQLQNRRLATLRNMYPNYYFDPQFKTIASGYQQFSLPTVYVGPDGKKYTLVQPQTGGTTTSKQPSLSTPGIVGNQQLIPLDEVVDQQDQQTTEQSYLPEHKKGGKVKKNKFNSSIVKAFKNL